MDSNVCIKISVRELVEFILRSGDICNEFSGVSKALEGSKAHRAIQKSRGEEYKPEVSISYEFQLDEITLQIDGRIDGVYKGERGIIIEEIKTTSMQLYSIEEEHNPLHWAQAKCYAYMYGIKEGLLDMGIQLTYFNREAGESKEFYKYFKIQELEDFFFDIINQYMRWVKRNVKWRKKRDDSIRKLSFPFSSYRKGQRELAVSIYRTIVSEGKIFAQAPTGTGKTMAAIFPTLKAMGEGHVTRVFYLTAKTITRTVAEGAFSILREGGLRIKTITLMAKEKMCQCDRVNCKPDICPYANGYYDRINFALEAILEKEVFTPDIIIEHCIEYKVCPFEFSLDLSLFCDCIICDYNYLFDPDVYLKRFFMYKDDYVFLIDEAHNLVDRGREMFSAGLDKSSILNLKRLLKGYNKELYKIAGDINSYFVSKRKELENNNKSSIIEKEYSMDFIKLLNSFIEKCGPYIEYNSGISIYEELMDIYFKIIKFVKISKLYNEGYTTLIDKRGRDIIIKLFCLDPSKLLGESYKRGRASILFSATFSPIDYFNEILGGNEEDKKIILPSPFDSSKLCVLLAHRISTKYKDREATYVDIVKIIYSVVSTRNANYIVYFPSYEYMNRVYERFIEAFPDISTLCQRVDMKEEERENFLKSFSAENEKALVGFAVMGGIFGEGIDLVGDRLSGVIVVGVGLPQICFERDIIKDYFNNKNGRGYEYSYIYPGINRVLQAAGRVIRSERDRGMVLLIDERFKSRTYSRLLPLEWKNIRRVDNNKEIEDILKGFWSN